MVNLTLLTIFHLLTEKESCINTIMSKEFNNINTSYKLGKLVTEMVDVFNKEIKPEQDKLKIAETQQTDKKDELSKAFFNTLNSKEVTFDFTPLTLDDFNSDSISPITLYELIILGVVAEPITTK